MPELQVVTEMRPPQRPQARGRHLISIRDLSRDDVERLHATARSFERSLEREMKKLPTLRGRTVVNLFYESSTRTQSSFELAAKRLSADTMTIKAVGSSVEKGESLKDTALTLSAYDPDVIVIRHPQIGAPKLVAELTDAHVVNAGDGKHQHPTQALLDLYTIRGELGRIEGIHVAIVGDVLHSRVARSNVQALVLMGARVTLVGPPALLPRGIEALGCETSTYIAAIGAADVVYVLRMQRERMEEGANYVPSLREYTARWGVTPERLRPGQKVMHPGPMNRGVEIDGRVADVDPHVHLRTPGREDEETIASGTRAAAAGGFCAILAMPNTEPVVDSAAVLGALVERARAEAQVPVGFLAAISKGQRGAELTEMAELADAGAAGFSDDGVPVASAGLMRRALQYVRVTGRRLALHCEEPTLSRGGHMHEGAVSAELGFAGYPSVAESLMVERDLALAAYEGQPLHLLHLSARESVAALEAAQAAGLAATAEVTPHHLCLTDEAVRSLDPNVKMNPPLRAEEDRQALLAALRNGNISALASDHAPHARHEKEVPFEAAPFGVTGLETAFAALYTNLVEPGLLPLETLLERMSAGPALAYGIDPPRIAVGATANLVLLDPNASWRVTEESFRSLSANSWLLGKTLRGRVGMTVAGGRVAFEA